MKAESAKLLRTLHAEILGRAEGWRKNTCDPHGINTAVYIALLEFANCINSVLANTNQSKKTKP